MPVLDSHHHLWDPALRAYPWMDAAAAPINRRFDVGDLRAAAPAAVTQTIVVQAAHALEETQELLRTAAASDFIAGVVGWVDLTSPDVAAMLARLRKGPGGTRLCGIRHQVENEPDPAWLLRSDVRRGLEAVAAADLCYDLLVRTRDLPSATTIAQRLPQVRFILDHGAKPGIAKREWEPWATEIAALAQQPNVVCKLSGLITEAQPDHAGAADIAPYAQRILDLFGPRRVLFGSDWPVCLLTASYTTVLDLAIELIAGYSRADCADVLHDNAQRVYLERTA